MVVCAGSFPPAALHWRAHTTHLIKTSFVNFNFNNKMLLRRQCSPHEECAQKCNTAHGRETPGRVTDRLTARGWRSVYAGYAQR